MAQWQSVGRGIEGLLVLDSLEVPQCVLIARHFIFYLVLVLLSNQNMFKLMDKKIY